MDTFTCILPTHRRIETDIKSISSRAGVEQDELLPYEAKKICEFFNYYYYYLEPRMSDSQKKLRCKFCGGFGFIISPQKRDKDIPFYPQNDGRDISRKIQCTNRFIAIRCTECKHEEDNIRELVDNILAQMHG